jgi:hypothetical protein
MVLKQHFDGKHLWELRKEETPEREFIKVWYPIYKDGERKSTGYNYDSSLWAFKFHAGLE